MELRQLRYFIAIVEHGSFSRAAAELGRTQQALSKAIRGLEESLGVRVLDRNSQTATPTVFGRLLLDYAQGVQGATYSFRSRLSQLMEADAGIVRLGAGPTSAGGFVADAAIALQSSHPKLRLEVSHGVHRDLIVDLQQGRLDLAVCLEPEALDTGPLYREVVGYDDYLIVAGATHPLADRNDVTLEALVDVPWLIGRALGAVEKSWASLFDDAGLARPGRVTLTTSLEFSRATLLRGAYLTILPRGLVKPELDAGTLREIDVLGNPWTRPVSLMYRSRDLSIPGTLAVVQALYAAARHGAS